MRQNLHGNQASSPRQMAETELQSKSPDSDEILSHENGLLDHASVLSSTAHGMSHTYTSNSQWQHLPPTPPLELGYWNACS